MAELTATHNLNLAAEATLDTSIQFDAPLAQNANHPHHIFLTGSTGLLGGYLLGELLQQTTAHMYCLVRGEDVASARQRLIKNLQLYGRWQDQFQDRITPILGDLAQPRLGLPETQFRALAGQVDAIYHSGGWVNNLQSYASLKPTNVGGTAEVIRLAALTQTKPVYFISSLAIFLTAAHAQAEVVYETDAPQYHADMKSGYTQSKWVADRLMQNAQKRGLPAAIYRPVRITADSKTGMTGETKDLLNLLLKSCLFLKKFPALAIEIPMLPVDYISQAIVHLSQQPASRGKAFHFINADPIPWPNLLEIMRAVGYEFDVMEYGAWRRTLKEQAAHHPDEQFLKRLQVLMSTPNNLFFARPPFDTQQTQVGLAGTSITCPPVDAQLVTTYLAYFQQVGFLPPADRVPSLAQCALEESC